MQQSCFTVAMFPAEKTVKNKVTFGLKTMMIKYYFLVGQDFKIVVENCGQKCLFQVFPVMVQVNIYDFFLRITKL